MDTQTTRAVRTIKGFIAILMDDEDTDRQLLIEGVEEMLTDLETGDELVDLDHYIRRYTGLDVIVARTVATRIWAGVEQSMTEVEEPCPYTHPHTRSFCGRSGCREA